MKVPSIRTSTMLAQMISTFSFLPSGKGASCMVIINPEQGC